MARNKYLVLLETKDFSLVPQMLKIQLHVLYQELQRVCINVFAVYLNLTNLYLKILRKTVKIYSKGNNQRSIPSKQIGLNCFHGWACALLEEMPSVTCMTAMASSFG